MLAAAAKLKAEISESPSSLTHRCNLTFLLLSEATHVERQLPDLFVRLDLCKAWHPTQPDAVLDEPEQFPAGHSLHVGRSQFKDPRIHRLADRRGLAPVLSMTCRNIQLPDEAIPLPCTGNS